MTTSARTHEPPESALLPLSPPRLPRPNPFVGALLLLSALACTEAPEPPRNDEALVWLRRAEQVVRRGYEGRRVHHYRTLGGPGNAAFQRAEASGWVPGVASFPSFAAVAWDGVFEESVKARLSDESREAFVELLAHRVPDEEALELTEEQLFRHERRSAFIEYFREVVVENSERLVRHNEVSFVADAEPVAGRTCVRVDAVGRGNGAGYALFVDRESGGLVRWVEFVRRGDDWLVVAETSYGEFGLLEPAASIPNPSVSQGKRLELDEVPAFLGTVDVARPELPERLEHVERWALDLVGMQFLGDVWSDGLAKVLLLQGVQLNSELEIDQGTLEVLEQGFGRSIAFWTTVKGYLVILVARGDRDRARLWFTSCL